MGRTGTLCIQYNPQIPKTPTSTTLSSSENFAMFSKIFISLVVLASTVAAAVPAVNKRATCANGKTTANDAARLIFFCPCVSILLTSADSAVSGSTSSTTFKRTCKHQPAHFHGSSASLPLAASTADNAGKTLMSLSG